MLTQQDIIDFCDLHDYDIRKSGNGRWIDQKCTPDVVTTIADCIVDYSNHNPDESFTSLDIWNAKYTVENVQAVFKKPDVQSSAAKNEYDKFFQQPMEMLANAKVLIKQKQGNKNIYTVNNKEILEYIALREKNALFFLKAYIEKVLSDSNLLSTFDDFFVEQSQKSYKRLKDSFSGFTIQYTKINGETECGRIFTKVINPLAYFKNLKGTQKGHLSKDIISLDMLMYNRNNFRDIYADKPKGVTRKEYAVTNPVQVNEAYYKYQSIKAKRYLRAFNDEYRSSLTEHLEEAHLADKAIHMHHIFPEAEFPEISFFLENIIALTPTQHYNYAHPDGRTQEIDEQYQHLLLLSKADRIQENLESTTQEHIYEFGKFTYVLNVGLDDDDFLEITDMDFGDVINAINMHYV